MLKLFTIEVSTEILFALIDWQTARQWLVVDQKKTEPTTQDD